MRNAGFVAWLAARSALGCGSNRRAWAGVAMSGVLLLGLALPGAGLPAGRLLGGLSGVSPIAAASAQQLYAPPPLPGDLGSDAADVGGSGLGGSTSGSSGRSAPTAPVWVDAAPEIRAQISPRRHTVLSAEIAGKITHLPVEDGARFAQGDLLAAIDCAAHEARRDRAAAQEQGVRRRLETAGRLDRLSSISRLEVDEAAAALAAAEAETALAAVFVSRCEVRAPFAGRVSARVAQAHQYVAEGQELLAILDDGALEVEMLVPSRWLTWLAPGRSFSVAIDELDRSIEAEIDRIGARVDPVSQSVKVYGRIPEAGAGLVAGMSGVARLAPPEEEPRG